MHDESLRRSRGHRLQWRDQLGLAGRSRSGEALAGDEEHGEQRTHENERGRSRYRDEPHQRIVAANPSRVVHGLVAMVCQVQPLRLRRGRSQSRSGASVSRKVRTARRLPSTTTLHEQDASDARIAGRW